MRDYRRVLDWAEHRPEIDAARMGLLGISFGAIDAVVLARSRRPDRRARDSHGRRRLRTSWWAHTIGRWLPVFKENVIFSHFE